MPGACRALDISMRTDNLESACKGRVTMSKNLRVLGTMPYCMKDLLTLGYPSILASLLRPGLSALLLSQMLEFTSSLMRLSNAQSVVGAISSSWIIINTYAQDNITTILG